MTGGFGKIINGQGKTFAPKNDTSKVLHESHFFYISTIDESWLFLSRSTFDRPEAMFPQGRIGRLGLAVGADARGQLLRP